jgi:HEAT repeat protein
MTDKNNDALLAGLEQKLSSDDETVRRQALSELCNVAPCERSFAILGRVMSIDSSQELQFIARKAYTKIQAKLEALKTERLRAANGQCEAVPDPDNLRVSQVDSVNVEGVLRGTDRDKRLRYIAAITAKEDVNSLPLLLSVLGDEKSDTFVISALVKAIGALGDADNIPDLQPYLKHPDSRVRSNAIEGLELIADDLIFPILVPMLQDPDNRVKGTTIKVLMNFNEAAARNLIVKLAASSGEANRASACYCLGVDNTPWSEKCLLKMIERESSVAILKIEVLVIMRVGTLISVGWFALQLQKAPDGRTSLYRNCLNSLIERHSLDMAQVTELRDLAAAGKFITSLSAINNDLPTDKEVSDQVNSGAGTFLMDSSPFLSLPVCNTSSPPESCPAMGQLKDSVSSVLSVGKTVAESYEEPVDVGVDLPEPSLATESWDETSIAKIVPSQPVSSINKIIPHGLPSKKKKPIPKVEPSLLKSIFNFKEGAGYLVPFLILVVVFGGIGVVSIFSENKGSQKEVIKRSVGDDLNILCRVRFVDGKKNTVTLCRGSEYFHGRFPKEIDLSSIKVDSLVTVKGVVAGGEHLNAMILDCTSIEVQK